MRDRLWALLGGIGTLLAIAVTLVAGYWLTMTDNGNLVLFVAALATVVGFVLYALAQLGEVMYRDGISEMWAGLSDQWKGATKAFIGIAAVVALIYGNTDGGRDPVLLALGSLVGLYLIAWFAFGIWSAAVTAFAALARGGQRLRRRSKKLDY